MNENIRIVNVYPKSIKVVWVKGINASVPLPKELEFVKKYRNRVPITHHYEDHKGNGIAACGTKYITGNFFVESTDLDLVNCKRCLKRLGRKNKYIDMIVMRTSVPRISVKLKRDDSRYIIQEDIGSRVNLNSWIFDEKLETSNNDNRFGWYVEVFRLNRETEIKNIRRLREEQL